MKCPFCNKTLTGIKCIAQGGTTFTILPGGRCNVSDDQLFIVKVVYCPHCLRELTYDDIEPEELNKLIDETMREFTTATYEIEIE